MGDRHSIDNRIYVYLLIPNPYHDCSITASRCSSCDQNCHVLLPQSLCVEVVACFLAEYALKEEVRSQERIRVASDEEQGSGETGRREATRSIEWGAEAVGRMQ